MATHGYTGLKHALVGSVTESVLHSVDIPVFVVTPDRNVQVEEQVEQVKLGQV